MSRPKLRWPWTTKADYRRWWLAEMRRGHEWMAAALRLAAERDGRLPSPADVDAVRRRYPDLFAAPSSPVTRPTKERSQP